SDPKPPAAKEVKSQPQPEKLVLDLRKDPEACTDDEAALLRALQGEVTRTADDLVEETGIPARRVMSALTMLQVRQLVNQHPGRGYEALVILKE
ncbi:MAG: DNA-protecting protein DprA, partial [Evtepia sp.]